MKEKSVFIISVADSAGIYCGGGWWNTLRGIIVPTKASHRDPLHAAHRVQGSSVELCSLVDSGTFSSF